MPKEKKYQVTVTRVSYSQHTFTVSATSKKSAEEAAFERACNHDFGTGYDAEYVIESVVPVKPKNL
jgi:hypothetical protein